MSEYVWYVKLWLSFSFLFKIGWNLSGVSPWGKEYRHEKTGKTRIVRNHYYDF
jgi:hypothetical protein